ncbi:MULTISPECIES: hypothetical protein [unclassified Nocardia]|uniref:hypothetical protein n=1 Tax=unclassified Nocardia TaxID=2637762 RepID=UPI001CE4A0B6|nr:MULTISPECIES: hypothetical protein [unclassified Nocardia]
MKSKIRWIAAGFFVLAIGYYLWHGFTYTSTDPFAPAAGWVGPQLALPIIAITVVPIVFAFSGDGILQALTGRNSSEFRNAPIGLGTITSFRQTGLTVNDQPQVRIEFSVEGAHGEAFESHAKMIVPLTELALLKPGVVLPVRYLPGRPERVEVDSSGDRAAAQRVLDEAMIRKGITTRAKLDIAARGTAAQAVVRALDVSGEIRDGHTLVVLDLVVTRPDGTTFRTRAEKFLSPKAIGLVQVGRIVQVRYLPDNEQDVVLALPVNA